MNLVVCSLGLAAAVMAAGCGSVSGNQQNSASAGAAGSAAPAAGAGGGASGGSGSSGHASGGSALASGGTETVSGGSADGGGVGGASPNQYVDQLRTNIPDACFPRELPFGSKGGPNDGRVACTIAELHFATCDCGQPGRAALSGELLMTFKNRAQQSQLCGGAGGVDCAAACGCEVVQLPGTAVDASSALYACQNDVTPPAALSGFCVIDQERTDASGPAPIGNPEIVANCAPKSRRRIRFVGQGQPAADAVTFISCSGSF